MFELQKYKLIACNFDSIYSSLKKKSLKVNLFVYANSQEIMMLNWSKVGKKHEKFNYLHILIKLKKSNNLEIDSSNLEGNMSHNTI